MSIAQAQIPQKSGFPCTLRAVLGSHGIVVHLPITLSARKLNAHKNVQTRSKIFKPNTHNVISTGKYTAKIWLSLYFMG